MRREGCCPIVNSLMLDQGRERERSLALSESRIDVLGRLRLGVLGGLRADVLDG